jgi:hypothetical protein
MPTKEVMKRVAKDKREGKSASVQAGEFVREQIDEIRAGKHGARNTKQAIAIGLSQARRAGVKLPPPKKGKTSERTRKNAERAYEAGQDHPQRKPNPKRSRATTKALKKEGTAAASHAALSRHAKQASKKRTAAERSASAKKAVATKGPVKRRAAAKKAARTRAKNDAN